jgi:DNA-binding transcriptional MocR family regulator
MKNEPTQKQWWAPVWKGLVMDSEAKHYRSMKNAVWLYLYLLLNANRKTGILMRKIETTCNDMGVSRDTVQRWLRSLRRGGYVETVNTGRSLTIQVTRWKALAGVGRTQLQKSETPNFSHESSPTSRQAPFGTIQSGTKPIPGFTVAGNDTKIQINIMNDRRGGIAKRSTQPGFVAIGPRVRQELLAQELARELDDSAGINLYRSYSAKYPEWLLRKALAEVNALPPERITKGRGALFNYLVQHHAKRITENPGG